MCYVEFSMLNGVRDAGNNMESAKVYLLNRNQLERSP